MSSDGNAANSADGNFTSIEAFVEYHYNMTPTSASVLSSQQQPAVPAIMRHYASSVNGRATSRRQSAPSEGAVSAPAAAGSDSFFPDMSPSIFADYEFFDKAGQGSFGKVMVVRHKATKHVRACKAVTIRSPAQAELIRTEINFLKSFDHPNILKLFETYFDGNNMYLISELCEGGSLLDRLEYHYPKGGQRKPMSEGLAALIMQQILSALAVLHAKGVIHRDVKPDNILFVNRTKESPLKLIDFGLATTLEAAQAAAKEIKIKRKKLSVLSRLIPSCLPSCVPAYATRRVMPRAGTLNFFSPEMVRGSYNELTDVFSAGIVLYLLLTGVHPFFVPGVDDENSVRRKISKRDVEFPPDIWSQISTDAKDLTRQLLVRDPRSRVSAGKALKHRWFHDPLKPTLHGNSNGFGVSQSVIDGLKEFSKSTRLKQVLLRILARELTEIQTSDLRKKFLALDKDGNGVVTRDELVAALKGLGSSNSVGEADSILCGETSISYNQFLAALADRKVKYGRVQMKEAFKKLSNGNSIVTVSELESLLTKSGMSVDVLSEACVPSSGMTFEAFTDIVQFGSVKRTDPPQNS